MWRNLASNMMTLLVVALVALAGAGGGAMHAHIYLPDFPVCDSIKTIIQNMDI